MSSSTDEARDWVLRGEEGKRVEREEEGMKS